MFIFFCWSWVLNWGSHACTSMSCLFSPTTFFQVYFHLWMKFYIWMFYLHFTCIYVCALFMPGTIETGRGYWISGLWNYRWFWAALCVLETEPGCSARAAVGLNLWVISPVPFSPTPRYSKLKVIYNVSVCCQKQGRGCINSWNGTDCPCEMSAPSHSEITLTLTQCSMKVPF